MTAVFIAHRFELVRRGLVDLIAGAEDLRVAGESGDLRHALASIVAAAPDVVVVEVTEGSRDGVALCRAVTESGLATRCLVLSDDPDGELLFDAIAAGAEGYLLDRASGDAVLHGIRSVASGRSLLDPSLTRSVFARLRAIDSPVASGMSTLTPQECRVLEQLSTGLTNRQIARQCGIAEKTVKNHVTSILRKLEITSRTQAALYARDSA